MEAILLSIRHQLAQLIWAAVLFFPLCLVACDEADHKDPDSGPMIEEQEIPTCPEGRQLVSVGKADGTSEYFCDMIPTDAGTQPEPDPDLDPCEGIKEILEDHPVWVCPDFGNTVPTVTFRPEMGVDNMCHPVLNMESTGFFPTDYTVQRHSHGFSIIIRDSQQGTDPFACCPEDQEVCPEPPPS